MEYDGLIISGGPGDPMKAQEVIQNVRKVQCDSQWASFSCLPLFVEWLKYEQLVALTCYEPNVTQPFQLPTIFFTSVHWDLSLQTSRCAKATQTSPQLPYRCLEMPCTLSAPL